MMEEVLSPMVEMAVTRRREAHGEESRFSTTSTDYTDEVIQDFRMSIAMPVMPVVGQEPRAVPPEQTTFMRVMHGHTKCVRAMAVYNPANGDSAQLVTSGDDGDAVVWDLQTFQVIHRLEGVHTHRIRGLAIYTPAEPPAEPSSQPAPMHHTTNDDKPNRSALHASVTDLYTRPLVITGSDDKTAAVWDLTSGTLVRHLTGGHKWFIMSVSVLMPTYGTSPFVVTSGWDNYSIVWNVSTGQQIMRLSSEHANAVSAVVAFVSPQLQSELGRNLVESSRVPFILTAGFDRIISIWDGETGQLLRTYPTKHTDIVSCAAVYTPHHSEHGLYALTGSFDGTAVSYNLLNGQVIRVLGGHSDWVTSVAMFRTNSGKPFFALGLTGCQDGSAVLWDLVYGIAIRRFEHAHAMPVTSVQFVARSLQQGSSSTSAFDKGLKNCSMFYPIGGGTDGATGGSGGVISVAHKHGTGSSTNSSASTNASANTDTNTTTALDYPHSQHFPYILTGSEDQRVVLWNLDSVQCVKFNKCIPTNTTSNTDPANTAIRTADPGVSKDWIVCMKIFAPTDGRRPILITGSTNHTITVYDVLTNSVVKVLYGHSGDVSGVDVFECSHEKYMKLHKQCVSEYGAHNTTSTTNTANPTNTAHTLLTCTSTDTSVLLVVSGSHDNSAIVWDYDTARPLHTLHTAHKENISSVAVSAEYGVMQCAILVLCSYDSSATVYDLYTNTILHTLANVHTDGITNCTLFKPLLHTLDSRPLLITTGIDGTAVVWDVCSGEYVRTLSGGHRERVKSVATYECKYNCIEPIVITGGYDKRAVVWSLYSGAVLRVLQGVHRNWVTAVGVVEPAESIGGGGSGGSGGDDRPKLVHSDRKANVAKTTNTNTSANSTSTTNATNNHTNTARGAPFIVTAGFDGVPVLWDLHSGELVSKLEGGSGAATSGSSGSSGGSGGSGGSGLYGTYSAKTSTKHTTNSNANSTTHTTNTGSSGIRCLAVYTGVPLDHGRLSPLVFTAGHDGAVTQHDTCYPFRSMPPRAAVLSLFHLDAVEATDRSWPRVTALSERFKQCLWMENSALFVLACKMRRSDFLLKFQSMLGVMLPRMGNIVENKTLLRYCVENKDLQCTRVLLNAWSALLNTDIGSVMIMKVHPSMYLHPTELLLLGNVYPAEFTVFIRSLRLVSVDFGVNMCSTSGSSSVAGGSSVTAGCALRQVTDPYKLFDVCEYGSEHSAQPVALCYLPLHHAASLDMLYMYLQTSIVLNSVEVFDTDAVVYALRYAWSYFAYSVHIRSTAMFALFILLYTPTMLSFESLTQSSDGNCVNFGWFLQTITFVSFVCRMAYTVYKSSKIVHTYSECIKYISDPWVVLDLLTQVFGAVGLSARYVQWGESDVSRGFLSLTTVLLWFRGLYYLRPFRASGPLVSMVLAIAGSMRVFVLIMIMALFGFSQGFWLLSHRGDHLPFGTIQRSMLSAFNYMMGSFDTEFEGSRLPYVGTFLVIVFVVFVIVLMLNLLIALMGNTFSMVSEKGLAQWRQEQVSIVLEERLVGGVDVPPCLFVLMSTTAYEEYVEGRDQVDVVHRSSNVYGGGAGASSGGASSGGSGSGGGSGGSSSVGGIGDNNGEGSDVGCVKRSAVDSVVLEKVQKLESRIDHLVSKLDYIVSKMD